MASGGRCGRNQPSTPPQVFSAVSSGHTAASLRASAKQLGSRMPPRRRLDDPDPNRSPGESSCFCQAQFWARCFLGRPINDSYQVSVKGPGCLSNLRNGRRQIWAQRR